MKPQPKTDDNFDQYISVGDLLEFIDDDGVPKRGAGGIITAMLDADGKEVPSIHVSDQPIIHAIVLHNLQGRFETWATADLPGFQVTIRRHVH